MTSTVFDWSAVAQAWDEHKDDAERTTSPVLAAVRDRLALRPGERVLELGCGSGAFARTLAAQVTETGAVLASDVAQGMVDVAARTLADIPHAEVRRIDAADTGLSDAGLDAVAFVMGLMFVPEPERAVREIHRVLRPGGRAAVTVWAGPLENPWLSCLGMAAMAKGVVAGGPPTGPGGLFSLADRDRFAEVLRAGDFSETTVVEVPVLLRWPNAAAWFDQVSRLSGPLAVAIAAAPEKLDAVRATALRLVAAHLDGDGLAVPGLAHLGIATR